MTSPSQRTRALLAFPVPGGKGEGRSTSRGKRRRCGLGSCRAGTQGVELCQQPRFSAGSVVRVDNTLAGSAIEHRDSHHHGLLSRITVAGADGKLGLLDERATCRPVRSVAQAASFPDTDSLFGGLAIGQGRPSSRSRCTRHYDKGFRCKLHSAEISTTQRGHMAAFVMVSDRAVALNRGCDASGCLCAVCPPCPCLHLKHDDRNAG